MVLFIISLLEIWGLSLILLFKGSSISFRNVLVSISYKFYWRMVKFILMLSHLLLNIWES